MWFVTDRIFQIFTKNLSDSHRKNGNPLQRVMKFCMLTETHWPSQTLSHIMTWSDYNPHTGSCISQAGQQGWETGSPEQAVKRTAPLLQPETQASGQQGDCCCSSCVSGSTNQTNFSNGGCTAPPQCLAQRAVGTGGKPEERCPERHPKDHLEKVVLPSNGEGTNW